MGSQVGEVSSDSLEVEMIGPLAMIAIPLAVPAPATAATYYVDGARGDDAATGTSLAHAWRTLEKANAALAPGDTCLVRGGVYENSQIAPARSGTAEQPITYAAYLEERPEVTGGRSGSIVNLHDRSYVVVRGFRVHSPTEHDWVVRITGEHARHNRLEQCDVSDPEGYAPVVIALGASYNAVSECTIHDTGHGEEGSGDCIVLNEGAHHNSVTRNRCYNACHSQILLLNGAKHNVISGNELFATTHEWAGAGVNLVLGSDSNVIEGNRIHDLGFITEEKCAIQIDTSDNVVRNNVIHDVGAFGISPQAYAHGARQIAANNLIANNTVVNCGRQPLVVISKHDCVAANNRFVNNIVVGSPAAWYGRNAWAVVFDTYHLVKPAAVGDWFGNVFESNLFYHEEPGEPDMVLYNHRGPAVTWSLSQLERDYPSAFRHNMEAAPQFVDPRRGDFRLKPGSPGIDAGTDVGLPFTGKAPDVGAVEG
jgi:hypothetical protein